jgi:hypothetical protein
MAQCTNESGDRSRAVGCPSVSAVGARGVAGAESTEPPGRACARGAVIKRKGLAVLSCLPIALFLLLAGYAPMPKAHEGPVVQAPQAQYLPVVICPTPTPTPPPPPQVFDFADVERDWQWLTDNFGDVRVERGDGSASVDRLRAVSGPASITLYVLDSQGDGVGGVPVAFYWPGADPLAPEYQACGLSQGIVGWTEPSGKIGFGLGFGSYYFPPGDGPHTIWLGVEGTDCLSGIGMLGLTNHDHLDSNWTLADSAVLRGDGPDRSIKQPCEGYRVITIYCDR